MSLYLTFYFSMFSECYGGPQSRGRALVCCWTLSSGEHSVLLQTCMKNLNLVYLAIFIVSLFVAVLIICFDILRAVLILRAFLSPSQLNSTWLGRSSSFARELMEPSSSLSPLAHYQALARAYFSLTWLELSSNKLKCINLFMSLGLSPSLNSAC